MSENINFPWLPKLEQMTDYGGDWRRYLCALYGIFCSDFIRSKPRFRGVPLALKRHPIIADKEATFWHIISEGNIEEERLPNMRRCERIRWPRPAIENCDDDVVKVWTELRGSERRTHIWLEPESYLVVLNERKGYTLLWTAYIVEREHERQKLNRRYEKYQKAEAAPKDGLETPSPLGR